MTMFIIGKVWVFAMIAGLILLFHRQSRSLGLHFLFGATAGLLLAFASLGVVSRLIGSSVSIDPLALAAGGLLGVVVGSRIALKLNLALGWQAQRATK